MLHNMKLQPEPFEMIKCGQKTYELRLLDTKRQKVSVGDTMVFLLKCKTSLKQVIFTLHPRILTEHILWVASLHITPNILNLRYIIYSNPLKTGIHTDSPP